MSISKYLGRFSSFGLILILFGSCQSAPFRPSSSPATQLNSEQFTTIAILGTNDLHGALAPMDLKTREVENQKSVSYQGGGIAYLASYIEILRSEFGNRLIWVDGGDQFQGTIESNSQFGAPVVQFFNLLGLTASAIGNHDFDFGQDRLGLRMQEAHYPYLAANLVSPTIPRPGVLSQPQPSFLISAGPIKVGIIGLSTPETPSTTRAGNVDHLRFEELKETTLAESKKLRNQGADIILITAHSGLKCERGKAIAGHALRMPEDPQGDCGEHEEIVKLLNSIPSGTVDAVVSGHTHSIVHHWVAGVPVVQSGAYGRYAHVIYLTYNRLEKKLASDQTRIEGPIPICPKFFQNQNDCNGDRPAPKNGRGPLVTPVFHGKPIEPHLKVNALIEPVLKQAEIEKKRMVGHAARPIEHPSLGESPLGNLVADAIREAAQSDVALVNSRANYSGAIRAPFEQGPITYEDVFRTLPFDNSIVVLNLTADELKMVLRIAESGARGFASVSGVQMRLIDPAFEAPSDDLKHDGHIELWEVNRLIDVRLSNGEPLQADKMYTFAASDFVTLGGDDFEWIMRQIPKERMRTTGIAQRDALVDYIQRNSPLNDVTHPLIDPLHPRLKFEKVSLKKLPEKRKRRRHSKSK